MIIACRHLIVVYRKKKKSDDFAVSANLAYGEVPKAAEVYEDPDTMIRSSQDQGTL